MNYLSSVRSCIDPAANLFNYQMLKNLIPLQKKTAVLALIIFTSLTIAVYLFCSCLRSRVAFGDVSVLVQNGKEMMKQGKYAEACEQFEEALKINPNHVIALRCYSVALKMLGKHAKACEQIEKALKIKHNHVATLSFYGIILGEQGKYAEACEQFEKALEIKPNHVATLSCYSIVLNEQGRYAEACEQFEKMLKINPNDAFALKGRDKALKMQNENA